MVIAGAPLNFYGVFTPNLLNSRGLRVLHLYNPYNKLSLLKYIKQYKTLKQIYKSISYK